MKKRIFGSICVSSLLILLSAFIIIMVVLYNYFSDLQHTQLKNQTLLASQAVEDEGLEYLEALKTGDFRITWIDSDGTVIFDSKSNSDDMENHLEREEIKEALDKGYGESSRYSSTLMESTLYSAQRLSDGSVIRLSIAQSSVGLVFRGIVIPVIIVVICALVMALVLAFGLSKRIINPLNDINLNEPLSNKGYDELAIFYTKIESQRREINTQENALRQKKEEFDTITENMNEGLILLNVKWEVISINASAIRFFDCDAACVGKNILELNRTLEMQRLLDKAGEGERSEAVMSLPMGELQIDITPVISDGEVSGAVILIFDVTERIKSEQMRREFTANVSHELKTPLHSISGYAELMKNGMVKADDIESFSGKIYVEAQRMIHLVEDIIRLSGLDEGGGNMEFEEINLYETAREVIHSLSGEAQSRNVRVMLGGNPATITGIPQLVKGIVFNLCDNAIKYNKNDGKVDVEIREEEQSVVLTVSDTGIGIPAEHLSRVFERFYRVDKSHSKAVGGTGLGLSIVKHAAQIHNAKVELKSVPGEGTVVTVNFSCRK